MKYLFIALLVSFSSLSYARSPMIEPGPVQMLNPQGMELLSVLTANARDFAEVSTFGNKVVGATVQHLSPEYSRYSVTVQQCQLRGCWGGARLQIERMRDLTPGRFPPYVYTTKIVRFR